MHSPKKLTGWDEKEGLGRTYRVETNNLGWEEQQGLDEQTGLDKINKFNLKPSDSFSSVEKCISTNPEVTSLQS